MKTSVSKFIVFITTAIICLWMISGARASSTQVAEIKTINRDGKETVQIYFSEPVVEGQILAEFQRNFLQLSIKGANAFPAKTANFSGSDVDKVFIYQYQPDLTRARILFTQDALTVQDRVSWSADGKMLEVVVKNSGKAKAKPSLAKSRKITEQIKETVSANSKSAAPSPKDEAIALEDERLIKAILNDPVVNGKESPKGNTNTAESANASAANNESAKKASSLSEAKSENEPISFGSSKNAEKVEAAKSENPITKIASSLLVVLSLIAAIAFGFKKFVLKSNFSGQRQGRLLDVVASHMLSPKKSIAVVRVGKQYLVLGITDANINLLQTLGEDSSIEKFLDDGFSDGIGSSFNSLLSKKFSSDETSEEAPTRASSKQDAKPSLRSTIKEKMASFKPL